jgi:5-formyltetrahydrofolate cyclo-ligase
MSASLPIQAASKSAVRDAIKSGLSSVPVADLRSMSAVCATTLLSLPEWINAGTVALYMSMPSEPGTDGLIAAARASCKSVLLPAITGKSAEDMTFRWTALDEDPRAFPLYWGIPQPPLDGRLEWPRIEPDLILVPGVAFDREGGRLGHGRGYYDAFLAKVRSRACATNAPPPFAVALTFDLQLIASVPKTELDEHVDAVITPTALYRRPRKI